jgi:hypothetical protein
VLEASKETLESASTIMQGPKTKRLTWLPIPSPCS